jgi:methylated-DNA-[protein]-cysteine S-methyltransferase
MHKNIYFKHKFLGALQVSSLDSAVVALNFVSNIENSPVDLLSKDINNQLSLYFSEGRDISLPIKFEKGTSFQLRVWNLLKRIPFGETITYGELSKILKSSPRAVGQACKVNPLPIIVPCHRVVAASCIGGYAGHTEGSIFERKLWLLQHEKNF